MNIPTTLSISCERLPDGSLKRPQLVRLTFGYRKRNQKKARRMRRQGATI